MKYSLTLLDIEIAYEIPTVDNAITDVNITYYSTKCMASVWSATIKHRVVSDSTMQE